MKIYGSMNVLAHEKQPVFKTQAITEFYDVYDIEIPEDCSLWENCLGETGITLPDGSEYMLNDVLANQGNEPCLRWVGDDNKEHRLMLKYVILKSELEEGAEC